MKVLISERKSGSSVCNAIKGKNGHSISRTPFSEVIKSTTVLFICCQSNENTRNMVDTAELSVMRPETIIVNVSRGNVVNTG
jgi:phosphoglycerate dehydrogenase-like enzyme